jgi:phosphoribosylaminoimidazole carboxylase (NCAIR synthetase)
VPSGLRRDAATIERYGAELARGLDLVGLVALELFVTRDGQVLANEMAPRPHNSGHWTIDACATSQFEQLVRAICGLPLGPVDVLMPSRMENLIGNEADDWLRYLADPTARLHLYGKATARPGRKMGPRHLLEAVLTEPPVQDFTWLFSFSIFMTSSMRGRGSPRSPRCPASGRSASRARSRNRRRPGWPAWCRS